MIKGWDKGVVIMKKGEKVIFMIFLENVYGEVGLFFVILVNVILKFDVEFFYWVSVKDICKDGGIIKKIVMEGKKWENLKDFDEVFGKYII